MTNRSRTAASLLIGALLVLPALAACSDDGSDVTSPSSTASGSSSSGSGSSSASGTSGGSLGYAPVSSVDEHAAMGEDLADIKDLLVKTPVDWAAVSRIYREGGASQRSDGTNRTFATLVEAPDVTSVVEAAIAGGPSDEVRAQTVEKGLVVLLARKVVDELAAAATKVAAGETDPAEGAPHNVDEAFAFFAAEGSGPATTAEKRAADFGRTGKVLEPIVAGLKAAQQAALDGDRAALARGTTAVRQGLNYVFYLATYKYLGGADAAERAEGGAFYLFIRPAVARADAQADAAIRNAFASGTPAPGRAALNRPAVLAALNVDATERLSS